MVALVAAHLAGCGAAHGSSPPTADPVVAQPVPPPPAAAASDEAPTSEVADATELPPLPFVLALDDPQPSPGTAEHRVAMRWRELLHLPRHVETFDLRVERTDIDLLGSDRVLAFSGVDPLRALAASEAHGTTAARTELVLVESGLAGRVLVALVAPDAEPADGAPGNVAGPWLVALAACPDDAVREGRPGAEVVLARCEDLRAGASVSGGEGSATETVRHLLDTLARLEGAGRTYTIVERSADVVGDRVDGERFVAPSVRTRGGVTTLAATIVSSAPCGVGRYHHTLTIRSAPEGLSIDHRLLAVERTPGACP